MGEDVVTGPGRDEHRFRTRAGLHAECEQLGVAPGDTVMMLGALSRVGHMLNGPDVVIGAVLDAASPGGTVLAYTDWDARYDELLDADARVPAQWRDHVPIGFAMRWLETRAGSPVAARPRGGSPSPHCCFPTQRGWWP